MALIGGGTGLGTKGIRGSGSVIGGASGIVTPAGGYAYLLDDYTGASAAYSVRLLSSSYAGSALRVRRSSDNAEQDIGFVDNYLDTASLLTFVGAGDGFVTTWYDQSGNSKDATQAASGSQPQVVISGSIPTLNSLAAIDSNLDFFSVSNVTMTGFVFAVSQNDSTSSFQPLFGNLIVTGSTSGGAKWEMRKAADASVLITSTVPATAQTVLSYKTVANAAQFWTNGTSQGTDTSTNAYPDATLFLAAGGVSAYQGLVQEVVVYPTDQTANRAAIETNINNYFSVY